MDPREAAYLIAGATLEKIRWPGIYRRGSRWVYAWTDALGNARRATASTREDASRLEAEEEQRPTWRRALVRSQRTHTDYEVPVSA